jgi:hypothetical protein
LKVESKRKEEETKSNNKAIATCNPNLKIKLQ